MLCLLYTDLSYSSTNFEEMTPVQIITFSQLIATLSKQIPTSIKSTDELINATMTGVVVAVGRNLLN